MTDISRTKKAAQLAEARQKHELARNLQCNWESAVSARDAAVLEAFECGSSVASISRELHIGERRVYKLLKKGRSLNTAGNLT